MTTFIGWHRALAGQLTAMTWVTRGASQTVNGAPATPAEITAPRAQETIDFATATRS